jgi:hypothetical protein
VRFLPSSLVLGVLLAAAAAAADPPPREARSLQSLAAAEADRVRFGITAPWTSKSFGPRLGIGVGWSLPQRWYDADGQLLTERSLLNPGEDLERSGLYFSLRF